MKYAQLNPDSCPFRNLSHNLPLPTIREALERCQERYFLTLTSKYDKTAVEMSRLVGEMLHRANRKLFGTAYHRHKSMRLVVFAIQEYTFHQLLHTHALIGIPPEGLGQKAFRFNGKVSELLTDTWCELDHGGERSGQNIQQIYDLDGVASYMMNDQ